MIHASWLHNADDNEHMRLLFRLRIYQHIMMNTHMDDS